MNDKTFQQWNEILTGIRKARLSSIEDQLLDKGNQFDTMTFFQMAKASLEEAIMKWWNLVQQEWHAQKPQDPQGMYKEFIREMESVLDYELEAIAKDLAFVRKRVAWQEKVVQKEQTDLYEFSSNLRKDYRIKLESLGGSIMTKGPDKPEPPKKRVVTRTVGSSSSGGTGGFFLFLLGLFLGGMASVSFWYVFDQKEKKRLIEMEEIRTEKRAMEDTLVLIQDTLKNLAYGKIRNIPQIQKDINRVKANAATRLNKVRRRFTSRRENLLKKSPPGDKLDRSLQVLETTMEKEISQIKAREAVQMKPYIKELKAFSDILGHQPA